MKNFKRKLLIGFLAASAAVCGAFGFAACGKDKESNNDSDKWGNVYTVEAAYSYAKDLGYSGTLDEFIKSISGKDGVNGTNGADGKDGTNGKDGADGKDGANGKDGINGKDGVDGVGIKNAYINEDGCLIIELTNGKIENCGNVYGNEQLQYAAIKEENEIVGYSVVGIGTVSDTDLNIPASYRGKPVTAIADKVFEKNNYLTSVTVPDSVTQIGSYAFSQCKSLESVIIGAGKGNLNIGECAFDSCSGLVDVTLSNSVITIGECAFVGCSAIKDLTIPDSVVTINFWAFSGCSGLTDIIIPQSVVTINGVVFDNCNSLLMIHCVSASKPEGWVDDWNCNAWGSDIYIPVVWDCKNNEFAEDGYLHTISDGIRYALKDGNAIVEGMVDAKIIDVIIPKIVTYKETPYAVTSVGADAFSQSSITSVNIPNTVTSIGASAFYYCRGLSNVTMYNSVNNIGEQAFWGCYNLTEINFNGTSGQWNAIVKGDNWNLSTGEYVVHCDGEDISKT